MNSKNGNIFGSGYSISKYTKHVYKARNVEDIAH